MCHICVLSLICLFIISCEFDALHQLSVKKDPLEIQHLKLENSRRGFIESATSFTPPSPELSATSLKQELNRAVSKDQKMLK